MNYSIPKRAVLLQTAVALGALLLDPRATRSNRPGSSGSTPARSGCRATVFPRVPSTQSCRLATDICGWRRTAVWLVLTECASSSWIRGQLPSLRPIPSGYWVRMRRRVGSAQKGEASTVTERAGSLPIWWIQTSCTGASAPFHPAAKVSGSAPTEMAFSSTQRVGSSYGRFPTATSARSSRTAGSSLGRYTARSRPDRVRGSGGGDRFRPSRHLERHRDVSLRRPQRRALGGHRRRTEPPRPGEVDVLHEGESVRGRAVNALLEDRDGDLWVGTAAGLYRFQGGRFSRFAKSDGLSDDEVLSIHEDREGSLWVGTREGLNRFWDTPFFPLASDAGPFTDATRSLCTTRDGSL